MEWHFSVLNHIPLHFKRFCVKDCPANVQVRKGNWHSSANSVAQMSSSYTEPKEQVKRVPGEVLCVSVSGSKFFKEMRSRGDRKENLILNSAEHVE